ncbi:hypothetical protein [Lacticaseibacillus paracasei]|uniref:hypothetical protein n=1 Tax=Lacticaseibacillus paracasei TaxID=1597 RepID=UPI0037C06D07
MDLVEELVNVVGKKNVITNKAKSLRFRKGYRSGKGDAVAVVFLDCIIKVTTQKM